MDHSLELSDLPDTVGDPIVGPAEWVAWQQAHRDHGYLDLIEGPIWRFYNRPDPNTVGYELEDGRRIACSPSVDDTWYATLWAVCRGCATRHRVVDVFEVLR